MTIQDAPDGTLWTEIVSVVVDTPVPPSPAHEFAVTKLARLTTSSTDYGTVVSWTVTAARVGILQFVEMESDDYELTRFQLTIGGVVQFTDIELGASLTLEWPLVRLAAEAVVLLEAKSSDGTEVKVDGDILGKEVG